jgi:hypothetical protein
MSAETAAAHQTSGTFSAHSTVVVAVVQEDRTVTATAVHPVSRRALAVMADTVVPVTVAVAVAAEDLPTTGHTHTVAPAEPRITVLNGRLPDPAAEVAEAVVVTTAAQAVMAATTVAAEAVVRRAMLSTATEDMADRVLW